MKQTQFQHNRIPYILITEVFTSSLQDINKCYNYSRKNFTEMGQCLWSCHQKSLTVTTKTLFTERRRLNKHCDITTLRDDFGLLGPAIHHIHVETAIYLPVNLRVVAMQLIYLSCIYFT